MPTLEELMAEVLDTPSQVQTKVASVKSASTEEIDKVLADLGLSDGESVKTASETLNETGGNMSGSLTDLLYGELLGNNVVAPAAAIEKVASEEVTESSESGLECFGEATGHYFNAAVETYFDKVAGDLMSESHGMVNPDPVKPSAVGHSLGATGSARLLVNGAGALDMQAPSVTTQNHGAYDQSLKEKAAILSRIKGQGQIGSKKV